MSVTKPYGWEMTLYLRGGSERRYHRVAPSEKAARRLGMLQPNVVEVGELRPLTRDQYERTYGRRDLR